LPALSACFPCLDTAETALLFSETLEAIWELARDFGQTGFDRVICYVGSISRDAILVENLGLRIAALPHFAQVSEFLRKTIGKPALDELHGLLNRRSIFNCNQEMHVVGHDHEIAQLEFAFFDQRPEYIDKKFRVSFRLQELTAHACFRGREKGTCWVENVFW